MMHDTSHDPFSEPTARLDAEVMDRYLAGEATPEEVEGVQVWMQRRGIHAELVDVLRTIGASEVPTPAAEAAARDRAWARVRELAGADVGGRAERVVPRLFAHPLGWIGTVAVLAIALGVVSRTISHSKRNGMFPQYTTQVGQRASITLRDGTHLTLAPQTRVSVAADFGKTSRTIVLSGEAYFDVSSSSAAPFVVRTGSVATRVLGTAFTVRHYATDEAVQIAVASGKVRANGLRSSVTIPAGHAAQVTDSTALITTVTDIGQYTDWAEGQLVFKRTPVPIVLATIERWYGYQFRMADSVLATHRISLTLNVSDSKEMLAAIKGLLEVDLAFDGNIVTLTPRRAPRPASTLPVRKDRFQPSLEMGR